MVGIHSRQRLARCGQAGLQPLPKSRVLAPCLLGHAGYNPCLNRAHCPSLTTPWLPSHLQAPERKMFAKGLAVVDGVAYFGLSYQVSRDKRDAVNCELAAFDLAAGKLLWRRKVCAWWVGAWQRQLDGTKDMPASA